MKKALIVIIVSSTFLSIVALSNDFNYAYWKNSHSKAVDNFRNQFSKEIIAQIFDTAKPNNIQISIVPFLKIIDSVKYYKPKNKSEFYNSIGIDTLMNYFASLKFNDIYCNLLVLNGKLVYYGRSDQDESYKGLKRFFDSNDSRIFVDVTHITNACISQHFYIDSTDLLIPSIIFHSNIDTNKPIGLYECLNH